VKRCYNTFTITLLPNDTATGEHEQVIDMKTKSVVLLAFGAVALTTAGFMGKSENGQLVVHEWGTFTSLQGSDGVPLRWNPLQSSTLPKFVYDWNHAIPGRFPSGMLALGQKGALVTLQRMETPVIYFYSKKQLAVDVSVRFPKGGITEWYPQAPEVGPSGTRPGPLATSLDAGLHQIGVPPNVSVGQFLDGGNIKESVIHWPGLKLVPASEGTFATKLPHDSSGSHYFAARETDSAYIESPSYSSTNKGPEVEKFLFYRGVGNFSTPLSVRMPDQDRVSVVNTGSQPLSHLFLLEVRGDEAVLVCLDQLQPKKESALRIHFEKNKEPVATVRAEITQKMEQSLRAEGLFPREASAMVNTWKDSWFQEQGARVLYLLPRAWTDEILPITIKPNPQKVVRVMVGRAELITPAVEQQLTLELTRAREGQTGTGAQLEQLVNQLGRFAKPAIERALAKVNATSEERGRLLALLYQRERR
jgi:hypothetical protein